MLENWEHYFTTRHEGLGTTYERFVLHAYFRRIRNRYGVRTVLEAPAFGMTGISGINSLWWAKQGAEVTLVDHSRERLARVEEVWRELSLKANLVYVPRPYASLPFDGDMFDMSWNFAALNTAVDVKGLLLELARVTQKVIFVCVPNQSNLLRPLFNLLHKRTWKVEKSHSNSGSIQKILAGANWELRERDYLDIPSWPDIAMPKEALLRRIGLTRYAKRLETRVNQGRRLCILDYYAGRYDKMRKEMLRYGFLEKGHNWLRRLWAHHSYQIFTPVDRIQ